MRPYGLGCSKGKDTASVYISDDRKIVEVRTSTSWRISHLRYAYRFAISETEITAWHNHRISLEKVGTAAAQIHTALKGHLKSSTWKVTYDTNNVRVLSPVPLSDGSIKAIWLAVANTLPVPEQAAA